MDTQAGYESSLRFRERRLYRWKVANIFSRSPPTDYSEPLLQSTTDGQRITTITILLRLRTHSQIPDRRHLFGQDQRGRIWRLRQAKIRGVVCGNRAAVQESSAGELEHLLPLMTIFTRHRRRGIVTRCELGRVEAQTKSWAKCRGNRLSATRCSAGPTPSSLIRAMITGCHVDAE